MKRVQGSRRSTKRAISRSISNQPDLLEKITSYTSIFGTIISLFFALYAINLSIHQSEDRSQINKLQELLVNGERQNEKLTKIVDRVQSQNDKILDLISLSRQDLTESKNQSKGIFDQLTLGKDLQNLTLHNLSSKITLDEHDYLYTAGRLGICYFRTIKDSGKLNFEEKLSILKKLDSLVSSQLTNPIVLNESFGQHWESLKIGITGLFDKLFFFEKGGLTNNYTLRRKLLINLEFPEIINMLKVIVDDNNKEFNYHNRQYYINIYKKYYKF